MFYKGSNMTDIKYDFLTLDDINDDDYEDIPCTDKNNYEFISLKKHYEESGVTLP